MPRTKGSSDLSKFQRAHIVGQHEGSLSQLKISENLLPFSAFNRVIVQFTRGGKVCIKSHPGRPGPSERTLHLVKRNVEMDPHSRASEIAAQADVSQTTAIRYLHKLGYYGRAVRRTLFAQLISSPEKIRLMRWWREL